MKKIITFLLAFAFVLAACGSDDDSKKTSTSDMKDGYYHAIGETASNGWTYFVTFDVMDGKVSNFNFDAVNLKTGEKETKVALSKAGKYNLSESAVAPFHTQAQTIIDYVNENNGFSGVSFDSEGKSDAISGATIKYGEVKDIYEAAANMGPVTKGSLTDGVYFGKADPSSNGYVDQIAYFVENGVILGVHVDSSKVDDAGETVFKTDLAEAGEYKLPDTAKSQLLEQYSAIEDEVIKLQTDFASIEFNEEGKSDAISGATISVDGFVQAFERTQ